MRRIISATEEIRNLPYEPGAWSSRASCLMQIGYPELAVGDAYKVTLLFDEIHNETSVGNTAVLMFGMKHWLSMDPSSRDTAPTDKNFQAKVWAALSLFEVDNTKLLIESLVLLQCLCDAQEICRDASRMFPAEGYFRGMKLRVLNALKKRDLARPMPSHLPPEEKEDFNAILRSGGFYRRAYPWMSSEMLRRDPSAISRMRKSVANLTTKCNIKKISTKEGLDETESDYYGMFAKEKAQIGEIILREDAVLCAARVSAERCPTCCRLLPNTPHLSKCCQTPYCTVRCANLAGRTYHASICKKDFSFLDETTKRETRNTLLLQEKLRLFAAIIQENASHPLKSTIVAPLHAQLGPNNIMPICLKGTIKPIIKILRALGIDIFADERWDTWVLLILWARAANNHRSDNISHGGLVMAINPAYSFFNHSCDPNAMYGGNCDDSSVTIVAAKPIAKGEEICISYLASDRRQLGVRERENFLKPWIGEKCFCEKCKMERDTLT